MRNKAKLFGVYLPVFIICTVAIVVMRTVACLTDFNHYTNYFSNKEIITAANIITVCAALFLFTYIFTARSDIRLIPSFTTPATFVPTGLVSAALVFIAIFMFDKAKIALSPEFAETGSVINIQSIIYCAAVVFAILSILHFLLTALLEKVSSSARANLGLCTVAFLAIYAIYLYFDTSLPINAPNKLLDEMVYLFASTFFLFETRLSLGREKWREYIAFGFIASMLAAYSCIPTLITYFVTGGSCISNNIYEPMLSLALFIFITARILLTGELIEDKESPFVFALSRIAQKRDETVIKNTEEARIKEEAMLEAKRAALEDEPEDENQIKIDDIIESVEAVDAKEALAPAEETATDDDNNETEKQDLTDEEDTGN